MRDRFDIVVAGGGPVGAALALSLRESGLAVALVEPRQPDQGESAAAPFRPIALSHASRFVLEQIGVFGALPVTPIQSVHISQAGGFGRTLIHARELDVPALGYVTDLAPLVRSLLTAAAPEHIASRVTGWEDAGNVVRVRLSGGALDEVVTRLLVLADGGHSAADDLSLRDYGQTAIVAPVRPERVAAHTAYERFTSEGPAALLPFVDRYALIWSVRTDRAPELMNAPDSAFLGEIKSLFGRRFGDFAEVGTRVGYPLVLRFCRTTAVGPRTIAIGNAAQTLHPVAGQGLNLGLRDAAELAEAVLRGGQSGLESAGLAARFAAQRRRDRYASIGITEGLVRVFGSDRPLARALRGAGLVALDLTPPARRLLARRFVFGLRALP
ncbi:MAG: FAD-dependent monooxygenase [Betaproteobacteria bacterium]|jgi:2-octaprenyl-6-methoxyphenol hydroxylase|nr:FAD-dependent monooxygenase [Betaproteobacteria bacterium]